MFMTVYTDVMVLTLMFLFSVVTTAPRPGVTQDSVVGSRTGVSKVIRFNGDSFIRYGFRNLLAEMVAPAAKESVSLQFITSNPDGLFWIWNDSRGYKMHIGLQVYD